MLYNLCGWFPQKANSQGVAITHSQLSPMGLIHCCLQLLSCRNQTRGVKTLNNLPLASKLVPINQSSDLGELQRVRDRHCQQTSHTSSLKRDAVGAGGEVALLFCWFTTQLLFTLFHHSPPKPSLNPSGGWGPWGCSASPSAVRTRKKIPVLLFQGYQPLRRDQWGLLDP